MALSGVINAQDRTSAPFAVGTVVNVRCTVVSITGSGAGAAVSLSVEAPGNVGDRAATFTVGPTQCAVATHNTQLGKTNP